MGRWVALIMMGMTAVVMTGCLSGERKAGELRSAEEMTPTSEPAAPAQPTGPPTLAEVLPTEPMPPLHPVAPTGPPLTAARDTWAKGELFRVWPYGNGEVAGYLGTTHGVRNGDVLVLSRGGVIINSIIVLNARKETFYGRVTDRAADAVSPRVGDVALKGPQPLMPKRKRPMTIEEEFAGMQKK